MKKQAVQPARGQQGSRPDPEADLLLATLYGVVDFLGQVSQPEQGGATARYSPGKGCYNLPMLIDVLAGWVSLCRVWLAVGHMGHAGRLG